MKRYLAIAFWAALSAAPGRGGSVAAPYAGTWRIEAAAVAPWWTGRLPPEATAVNELVGGQVTISARAIDGPGLLACASPRFRVAAYPAELLFQGNFGEMQRRRRQADPAALAAAAGLGRRARWQTLETGCHIDLHFVNRQVAAFALDNYIFTIRRQR